MFTKEEEEIMAKDSQKNPNCSYSISSSRTCMDKNGDFTCEMLRKLQRMCPGKSPTVIYSQSQKSQGTDDDMNPFNGQNLFPFGGGEMDKDPLMGMFGGLFENFMNLPNDFGHPGLPPHHRGALDPESSFPKQRPSQGKVVPGKVISDSIEEI